jgi:hypothetical protein
MRHHEVITFHDTDETQSDNSLWIRKGVTSPKFFNSFDNNEFPFRLMPGQSNFSNVLGGHQLKACTWKYIGTDNKTK